MLAVPSGERLGLLDAMRVGVADFRHQPRIEPHRRFEVVAIDHHMVNSTAHSRYLRSDTSSAVRAAPTLAPNANLSVQRCTTRPTMRSIVGAGVKAMRCSACGFDNRD